MTSSSSLADYYTEKPSYEKVSRGRLEAIRRLMPAARPLTVLDIGCGSGTLGEALKSDPKVRVFGLDVAPQAVEQAAQRLDGAWVADITSEDPWPPEVAGQRYDLIVISEVLEHLFFPEHLLKAARSLLAPGGSIVITVPNILFWRNRLRLLGGKFAYEDSGLMDRGHIHFFSWQSFRDLIRQEGLRIDASAHVVPTRIVRPFADLLPGLFAQQFAVRISLV